MCRSKCRWNYLKICRSCFSSDFLRFLTDFCMLISRIFFDTIPPSKFYNRPHFRIARDANYNFAFWMLLIVDDSRKLEHFWVKWVIFCKNGKILRKFFRPENKICARRDLARKFPRNWKDFSKKNPIEKSYFPSLYRAWERWPKKIPGTFRPT